MAFCTKCGRPLQDGEVCNCQQQAAPQITPENAANAAPQSSMQTVSQAASNVAGAAMAAATRAANSETAMGIAALLKGLFTSPVETIAEYVAKVNVALVCIFVGGSAIVDMLVRLFRMLIANAEAKKVSKSDDWWAQLDYAYNSAKGNKAVYDAGDIFKNMFQELLDVAVAAVLFSVIVMLFIKLIDKVNVTFMQTLAVFSLTCLLAIPADLLSWLVGLTDIGFFDELSTCISVFARMVGYVFVFFGIKALSKNEKSLPLTVGVTYVAISFASWLITLMFQ